VVMVVALIVLGPDKLPDAARSAAKMIGELRRMTSGLQAEVRDTFGDFAEPFSELVQTVTGGVVSATSGQVADAPAPDGVPAPAPPPPLTGLTPLAPAGPGPGLSGIPAPTLPMLPPLNGTQLNGAQPAPGTFAPGPPASAPIFAPLVTAEPEGFSPGPERTDAPGPA
jgi:mttA/Hcf106 family